MAQQQAPAVELILGTHQHQFITVNQVPYDLRSPGDVFISQQLFLESALPKVSALMQTIHAAASAGHLVSESDDQALDRIVRNICYIAVQGPRDVVDALSGPQRLAIVFAFLRLPAETLAQPEAPHQSQRPARTGQRSSRSSRGSTGATR